jgi:membrane protein YqaA with SNARE-associated domain
MGSFVAKIRVLAIGLGAPGLFLITALDSSFLSLPEIADLLVVFMVAHHKSRFLLYALSATLGSLAGSLALYYIGRKGGEALVRRRFATASVERAMTAFQRHGLLAVLIPSILPPPAPFKIFVLLAGVTGITPARFTLAILIGRSFRYLTLAILAVRRRRDDLPAGARRRRVACRGRHPGGGFPGVPLVEQDAKSPMKSHIIGSALAP